MTKFIKLISGRENRRNLLTYIIFLFIAVSGIIYGTQVRNLYPDLRIWEFTDVLIMLAGIPFILLQSEAGIPDFWDIQVSGRNRLKNPFIAGLAFGILDVIVIRIIMHPQPYSGLPPFIQPFPYSVFLYFSGAFEIEVFYRLIPLTIIMLTGKMFRKGRYLNAFFIAGAILTSLREPLEQMPSGPGGFIVYAVATGFLMNLMQALFFRKAGFISSLVLRLGHYLVWHILLGIYIEFIELPGIIN